MTTGTSMTFNTAPQGSSRPPKHVPVLTQKMLDPEVLAQLVPQTSPLDPQAQVKSQEPTSAVVTPYTMTTPATQSVAPSAVELGVAGGTESEVGLEPDALMAELYVEQLGQVIESLVLAELKRQTPTLARDIAQALLPKVVSELGLKPKI